MSEETELTHKQYELLARASAAKAENDFTIRLCGNGDITAAYVLERLGLAKIVHSFGRRLAITEAGRARFAHNGRRLSCIHRDGKHRCPQPASRVPKSYLRRDTPVIDDGWAGEAWCEDHAPADAILDPGPRPA